MTKTCLRCDWQGDTIEPACPNCGASALYVVGASASDTSLSPSNPAPSVDPEEAMEVVEDEEAAPPGRSVRSIGAFVLAALVLTIGVGTWITSHEGPSTPAVAADDAREEFNPLVTPAPTLDASESPIWRLRVGRRQLALAGVPFSFRVPENGWTAFGHISINKSTVGSQGAEGIVFWTTFRKGNVADPCIRLLSPPIGPSAAELAAAVSTAPGTALVAGPSEVAVGGRVATRVKLIVHRNVGCRPGFFFSWDDEVAGPMWTRTHVGDAITVWILRVHHVHLVIEAETGKLAHPALQREIAQIVGSIRFPRPMWEQTRYVARVDEICTAANERFGDAVHNVAMVSAPWSQAAARFSEKTVAKLRALTAPPQSGGAIEVLLSRMERQTDLLYEIETATSAGTPRVDVLNRRRVRLTHRIHALEDVLGARWGVFPPPFAECPLSLPA